MDSRSVPVKIGGKDYNLTLTTLAEHILSKKYGGISEFGTKMFREEDFDLALDETAEILVVLANQEIMLRNLDKPDDPEPLLSAERVLLSCTPLELAELRTAAVQAISLGRQRNVESEKEVGESKNA